MSPTGSSVVMALGSSTDSMTRQSFNSPSIFRAARPRSAKAP
ncbi:Uncharacterised protein [Mycobacteroides abscessus subsp. abscessus]|nr:Uncharacterised protein [Mycobacteroides abscessus subsp. abscessus]